MRYRRLNETGDMTFGNQQADFLRNTPETVAQAVMTRLRLWETEWFIDLTEGTPYQKAALGKYTQETVEPMIRSRILDTQGVTSVESLFMEFNPDTRTVKVEASINTVYGQTNLRGIL